MAFSNLAFDLSLIKMLLRFLVDGGGLSIGGPSCCLTFTLLALLCEWGYS